MPTRVVVNSVGGIEPWSLMYSPEYSMSQRWLNQSTKNVLRGSTSRESGRRQTRNPAIFPSKLPGSFERLQKLRASLSIELICLRMHVLTQLTMAAFINDQHLPTHSFEISHSYIISVPGSALFDNPQCRAATSSGHHSLIPSASVTQDI